MTEVENPGSGRDAEKLPRAVQTTVRERVGAQSPMTTPEAVSVRLTVNGTRHSLLLDPARHSLICCASIWT